MQNPVKTVVTVDRVTTLELDGLPRTGQVKAKLVQKVMSEHHVPQETGETIEVDFRLTSEVMRNIVSVLDTYR